MIQWVNKWIKGKNGVESPKTIIPRVVVLLRAFPDSGSQKVQQLPEGTIYTMTPESLSPRRISTLQHLSHKGQVSTFCQGDELFAAALNVHGIKISPRSFSTSQRQGPPAASSLLPNPQKAPLPIQGQRQASLKSAPEASFPENQGSIIHGSRTQPG